MAWTVEITSKAEKSLKKIDPQWQKAIFNFVENELRTTDNPRRKGKSLTGDLTGLWRYRVGKYRIICHIDDDYLVILVLDIGHHNEIYR